MKTVSFRYINRDDVLSLRIDLEDVLSVTEKTLDEHGRRAFEMPPKPGIHPRPGAFIHAMPAFLSDLRISGLKWVSGFPENRKQGFPTIAGLLILNDPETGMPLCVMDATWLTAVRTAAVSGVAVRHLSGGQPRILGIVGAGAQGRHHAEMIRHVCASIEQIVFYDISHDTAVQFKRDMEDACGSTIRLAPDPETVFKSSDIVVTATGRQNRPMVGGEWLRKGGLYLGLESFRYWQESGLLSADKFVTDDWNQAQTFLKISKHIRTPPRLYGELSEIVMGTKPGREGLDEKIVCIFCGMAIFDIALGDLIYRVASDKGVGSELPMMHLD